jgi:thioredoxin reductase (NADPH)
MEISDPAAPGLQETPDEYGAFPRLGEGQLARLQARGERRRTEDGEVLFEEGDTDYDFHVVLEGLVAVLDHPGFADERVIAVHGRRRFLGELGLLTGQSAFSTAVVREAGEELVVAVEDLRAIIGEDPALGDMLLRAYFMRRERLIGLGAGLRIIGSRFSAETRRLREFSARNRLPHRWIDLEQDADAEELLRQVEVAPEQTPVVIWHGQVLRNPSNEELARAVGLRVAAAPQALCDLLVVGAGPAGLAASVYGASEGLGTVTLDAIAVGGRAGTSARIENYLGFPAGISGGELGERATIQAKKFGARILVPAEAVALEPDADRHRVRLADDSEIVARTIVIASGAHYRRLPAARLEEFESDSVYYAATLMEAQMCAGDPVVIVGGGNSAGQAALFLLRYVSALRLLVRCDALDREMSRYLADRIERSSAEVLLNTVVRELDGEGSLEEVVVENTRTGERSRLAAKALFVFIGAEPFTGWLQGHIALDGDGFVLTGPDVPGEIDESGYQQRRPLLLETSRPGVMAVGDVRSGSIKRVASAVGEGSMAVRLVHEFLERAHQHPHHVP